MRSKKLAGNKISTSTQRYLDISEVKDDCVILKDGTLRSVLLVSSINFALKSEDEQNAIISSYVSFLNFLEYPIQIVIQSRKLDIDGYLEDLKRIEKEQTNDLLRMQTADYRNYVGELVNLAEIMTKRFYIVVPYNHLADQRKNFFGRIFELFTAPMDIRVSKKDFMKRKRVLNQRVEHVLTQLNSMGLKAVILDTQSLIELYYNSYNLEVYNKEKLVDLDKLRIE